jgi:hypothetical protein
MREPRGRRRGAIIAAALATVGLLLAASLASSKSGDQLRRFQQADHGACIGQGIAFDGRNLVAPCFNGAPAIDIISPANGSLVRKVNVSGQGTVTHVGGAASWDARRKVLWDCLSTQTPNQTGVGTIDLATGTASMKFTVQTCQAGLAYDPTDDTIWASGPNSTKIQHYRLNGTLIADVDVPPSRLGGQGASGLEVVGDKLYVGNGNPGAVYRVRKDFSSSVLAYKATPATEDMECDDNTFSSKAAMWNRASNGEITAHEIPGGTCASGASGSDEPPPPVAGKSVVANVVSGTVFIEVPTGKSIRRGKKSSVAGTARFKRYKGKANIPVGSKVDTKRGRIAITSAADLKGSTQTADFYDGVFQIKQARAARPTTDAVLITSTRGCAGKKAGASAGKKRLGRLWATGKGRFRTKGRYSAAAVRGTTWLTEDRCDGTFTKVSRGRVSVRDNVKRKTIILSAGQSYLARAQRASGNG